ncbi:unnamed protein product [Cercopithifilaria johnstoni]|uniref:Uncharacterized protein n=1 Tax=Cercopithifilaria johnstoni TaxID=2874296 RepID=A0A8J2MRL8_9BILA|nr:unnamed protein product [Cercopithifilaria johnstoni]
MFKFLFPEKIKTVIIHFLITINNLNIITLLHSLLPIFSFVSSSSLSLSLSPLLLPTTTSTSSPLPSLTKSMNSQTITDLCGKQHIVLDYKHPEYVINYPATFISDNTDYMHQEESYLASEEKKNERQLPYPLDFYINNDISTFQ